jgi:hypothetical protein
METADRVNTGSICYGYTANVISATLAQPTFIEYFALATRSDGVALLSATNGVFQSTYSMTNDQ